MFEFEQKICPVCGQMVSDMSQAQICPRCGTAHHADCWYMSGGCSAQGCNEKDNGSQSVPFAAFESDDESTVLIPKETDNSNGVFNSHLENVNGQLEDNDSGTVIFDQVLEVNAAEDKEEVNVTTTEEQKPEPYHGFDYLLESDNVSINKEQDSDQPTVFEPMLNQNQTPSQNQMSGQMQEPYQNQIPIPNQMPVQNQMLYQNQMPVQNQMPYQNQMSYQNQMPVQNQMPYQNQMSYQNQMPVQNQMPGQMQMPALEQNVTCTNCGSIIVGGQRFCSRCGQKAGLNMDSNVSAAISMYNANVYNEKNKKKSKTAIIIAVAVALVAILFFAKIAPMIFIDTEGYIERGDLDKAWQKAKTSEEKRMVIEAYIDKGDYASAYRKAPDSDKNEILALNAIAHACYLSSEAMYTPDSFILKDAWYNLTYNKEQDRIYQQVVLLISGYNKYGSRVENYWLLTADAYGNWEVQCSSSTINPDYGDDEYYDGTIIRIVMTGSHVIKLDRNQVDDMNDKFERGKLSKIRPMDTDDMDTTLMHLDSGGN